MRRPFAAAWRTFRAAWKELLLFVLFFQALTFVLLAPVGSWVLARLVSAGGSAVVSNEELAAFSLAARHEERAALSDEEKILLALSHWWRR
ncbi:MAG: hypothetical protein ACYSUM_18250 [Planctomycetota bacterium]